MTLRTIWNNLTRSNQGKKRITNAQAAEMLVDFVDQCAHERIANNGISVSFAEVDNRITKRVAELRRGKV